jgi:Protein of unknown function (DUF3293)
MLPDRPRPSTRPSPGQTPRLRPALLRAYHATCYRVAGITLHIGRRCAAVDRLLRSHRARSAVLVSACNPYSRVMPPGWNRRMQERLRQALRRRTVEPGLGSLGRWSESHWLVFADPRPVRRLARLYRQNAIVIVRQGQAVRLMMLV